MKIFIAGINGKMGKVVASCAIEKGYEVVGGFDFAVSECYPTFKKACEVNVDFDVIIDFSRPAVLPEIISLCESTKKPVVIATTGYNETELAQIEELASKVPVFMSANMSLGINVMANALKELTLGLSSYDKEIIEAHHNQKVDATSGTAKLLLNAIEKAQAPSRVIYGREGDSKREEGEIGVHAIRAGTIFGEHTVIFAGADEIIEIKHTALSRSIFANGAIDAGVFLLDKNSGKFDMNDYIKNN